MCMGDYGLDGRLGKPATDTLDSSTKTAADTRIYAQPTWLIAVKKGCWSLIQTELLNSLTHWYWMFLIETIFNLAEVNTVSCMCEAALSLSNS